MNQPARNQILDATSALFRDGPFEAIGKYFAPDYQVHMPSPADFAHKGIWVSVWLLGLGLFMNFSIAIGVVFNGHYAASVADGIPSIRHRP